jgi:hypothetical protein
MGAGLGGGRKGRPEGGGGEGGGAGGLHCYVFIVVKKLGHVEIDSKFCLVFILAAFC